MTKENVSKLFKCIKDVVLFFFAAWALMMIYDVGTEIKNIQKHTKTEVIYLPAQNECPLKFDGICYPVSKVNTISCGEMAGHEGVYDCQVLYSSEPRIEIKKEGKR